MKEIEIKFLLRKQISFTDQIPQHLKQYYFHLKNLKLIKKGYLYKYFTGFELQGYTEHMKISELRIRVENNKNYFIGIKTDGTNSRDEFEVECTKKVLDELKTMADIIGVVSKNRYRGMFMVNGHDFILECDKYLGALKGLTIYEIEYGHVKYADHETMKRIIHSNFGDFIDITNISLFKNKKLAQIKS